MLVSSRMLRRVVCAVLPGLHMVVLTDTWDMGEGGQGCCPRFNWMHM
jgi:hypothetical protein